MEVKAPQSSFLPQHCLRVPLLHTCPAVFPRYSALVGPEGGAPGGTEKAWSLGIWVGCRGSQEDEQARQKGRKAVLCGPF